MACRALITRCFYVLLFLALTQLAQPPTQVLEVGEDKDLKEKDHSRFQRYDTGQDLSWMEGGKQATREREGMEEVLGLTLMGPTVSFLKRPLYHFVLSSRIIIS